MERSAIKLRPVIRYVFKEDVVPYVLSIAEKHSFLSTGDSISLISISPSLWSHLRKLLKAMKKDVIDFDDVHSMSLDCLQTALELHLDSSVTSKLSFVYRPWNYMGLFVDSFSIVNRRRRQEDRCFATSDLPNYAGAWSVSNGKTNDHAFPLSAVGVFDGHKGPEAAEHCSHLAPYLLSIGLHRQLNNGAVSVTDLLVDVFYELNQSVNKGRASGFWSSGTTATICIFYGDSIYTAWVGDSQAWLVYMKRDDCDPNTETAFPSVANSDRLTSLYTPVSATPISGSISATTSGWVDVVTKWIPPTEPGTTPKAGGCAVALTDTLHRPEFASEFVSVIRGGGMVTTEVIHDDTSTLESRSFAGVGSRDTIQASLFHTKAASWLNIPPLSDPGLTECRVGGVSCVSRAIGDDQIVDGVSALPSVTVYHCQEADSAKPLCLILASDGLWDTDCCSGPKVAERAQQWFHSHSDSTGEVKKGFAKELAQLATDNGASDNVTCVVLWMNLWNLDNSSEPKVDSFLSRKMLWPCGSRVSSSVDIRKPHQLTSGRHHSSTENVCNCGIRYSSPPRYKSSSSLFFRR